ncbi:MAG: hypothetical protein ACFFDN_50495 [Candidatus Hodarchaeota archaeon]
MKIKKIIWHKKILKISLTFSFILLFLFSINLVQAATVWEENFEEGIPDGWDFDSYNRTSGIHEPLDDPGFSVVDGVLRAPNHQGFNNRTEARRNNTVAYGTWSFDWLASSVAYDAISLISNHPENNFNITGMHEDDFDFTGYSIRIDTLGSTFPRIDLLKLYKEGGIWIPSALDSYYFDAELEGTHHIDVTRDSEGQFHVYFDTILVLTATDNDFTTSQKFSMVSWSGDSGIDNITVSDTVDYPPSPPGIPATTWGYIVWMVIPTIMILIIMRKKVKFRN